MIIYCTTNLINGKKYIGKDVRNTPGYLGSGILLIKAINKYGKENFQKEILCTARDKQDLDELEIYYIDYYNAQSSDLFYNLAPGGTGGKVHSTYNYIKIPVYEINTTTFQIIKEYQSSKEAAIVNNLNFKCLNAVVNGSKRTVSGRVFIRKQDYNLNKLIAEFIRHDVRTLYLSKNTGVYYFHKNDIWFAEFSNYCSFNTFKTYLSRKINKHYIKQCTFLHSQITITNINEK